MTILVLIYLFIILGIVNAGYLYWQHVQFEKNKRKMVCPLNGHCEAVVESKYGTTLGIKNDILGILYLLALAFLITVDLSVPALSMYARFAIMGIATFGILFSTYLTYLQAFVIKEFCTWCVAAALDNFILVILIYFYIL